MISKKNKIDLSIVIVTYKTKQVTIDCIESIYKSNTKYSFEIIVVDNNSQDGTVEYIQSKFPNVILIPSNINNGFSKGNNIGIQNSSGDYVMLLNSDTLLFKDSIDTIMYSALKNGYKICGPVLLNNDLSIQRSWFNFPSSAKIFLRLTEFYTLFYKLSNLYFIKFLFHKYKPAFMLSDIKQSQKMNYLSFACVLISRDVFNSIGLLDENLIFYHEDCEYGIRANKSNYEIYYNVDSRVIHLGGTSSSSSSIFAFENDIRGLLYVYKKHYSQSKFKVLKLSIYLALSWRIIFWHFGFYRQLKKYGIYKEVKQTENKKDAILLYEKYNFLRNLASNYV
jgi:GT2 family glycosyltransferase